MSDLGPVVEPSGLEQELKITASWDFESLDDIAWNHVQSELRQAASELARLSGELRGAQAQSLHRWEGWTDVHYARQQAEADREAALKQRDRAVEALRLHMEWIGPPRTDPESYDSLREDAWRKGRVVLRAQAGGDS